MKSKIVNFELKRRVELTPGVVSVDLVSSGTRRTFGKLKIDKAFAQQFAKRLQKEALKIPSY